MIKPGDITWTVEKGAYKQIRALPREVHANYAEIVRTLRETVCDFINAKQHCDGRTHGVACVGGLPDGGKALKVRCALPGRGANRSLRVQMGVFCAQREAVVLEVEWRRDKE